MKTLDEIRHEIDSLDTELRRLLTARLELSKQVAENKLDTGLPIYRPEREADICKAFSDGFRDPDVCRYASAAYRAVLRTSREYQYHYQTTKGTYCDTAEVFKNAPAESAQADVVCFQGIEGSWSDLAARRFYPESLRIPVASFAGVFDMITSNRAQAGVLPLDNSTAGTVNDVYDLLIKHDYYIVKATPVPIHNCLMALPGARIEDIRKVHSHQQALSQCAAHVKSLGAIPVPETNTAVAAKAISVSGDISSAAIASPDAARKYGLQILQEDFNDAPCNQTRFLSVSRTLCKPKDANRLSLAFCAPNESGALANLLALFADNRLNLTKIMSRPMPDAPWEYIFYLDCEIQVDNPALYAVLYQLGSELRWLRLLGCYREEPYAN